MTRCAKLIGEAKLPGPELVKFFIKNQYQGDVKPSDEENKKIREKRKNIKKGSFNREKAECKFGEV